MFQTQLAASHLSAPQKEGIACNQVSVLVENMITTNAPEMKESSVASLFPTRKQNALLRMVSASLRRNVGVSSSVDSVHLNLKELSAVKFL